METPSRAATRTRVLVVEDDRASRSALMALLRMTGFHPLAAGTIAEGIALLAEEPAVLLLDLMLPDGNGTDLLGYIRRNGLPISVALTTGANDWQTTVANAGNEPDAVFPKPLDFKGLVAWLGTCQGA